MEVLVIHSPFHIVKKHLSIEKSISHIKPLKAGDTITAIATEKSKINRIGIYEVRIENEQQELVALFKDTVCVQERVGMDRLKDLMWRNRFNFSNGSSINFPICPPRSHLKKFREQRELE